MNDHATRKTTRREALRTGLRLGGLGGLVALAAGLRMRNGGCATAGACAGCPAFAGCGLPQAQGEREQSRREVPHG